jgi:hypothetical protein
MRRLVTEALHKAGRTDLIGYSKDCLIRPLHAGEKKSGEEKKERPASGKAAPARGGKKPAAKSAKPAPKTAKAAPAKSARPAKSVKGAKPAAKGKRK